MLTMRLLVVALVCAATPLALGLRFGYPSYSEVVSRLHALNDQYPQFVDIWSAQVQGAGTVACVHFDPLGPSLAVTSVLWLPGGVQHRLAYYKVPWE